MTDADAGVGEGEGARPAWPAARPSWDDVPAAREEKGIDLKLVIAVLIGLVSVTGAVMTWRAAQLGENATDNDRLTLAQTVDERRDESDLELTVQDARRAVAAHAGALRASQVLAQQAGEFDGGGNDEAARVARDESEEQQALALGYLSTFPSAVALSNYVTDEGGQVLFNERGFRADLQALSVSEAQADPELSARTANALRDQSQRYDLWRIPLAGAVLLLAIAQVLKVVPLRWGLTGIAVAVWIGSTVIAFGGGA